MNPDNRQMLLRDPDTEPTDTALENVMGANLYAQYHQLIELITTEFGMQYEWRYYNDGKAWLFKSTFRKKTVFWLSAWEGSLKISFYFSPKAADGMMKLTVSDAIKNDFAANAGKRKFIPLTIETVHEQPLENLREMIRFKISQK